MEGIRGGTVHADAQRAMSPARAARRGTVLGAVLAGAFALHAGAASIVQTFFVPLPEEQVRGSLLKLYTSTGATFDSVVSVVVNAEGTRVVYDHWEDGYETDLDAPVQATTQVWGDGNNANGIAPGFANDPVSLPAGTVFSLRNLVSLPRNPAQVRYDGRDRVGATKAIVVSRAAWATTPGSVLAGAVEVSATLDYGQEFISPVGENVSAASMFQVVDLFVQAAENGTTVSIDKDADTVFETVLTLNRGESHRVNGGVLRGARVVSSKPVHAHLITGNIGANYESRWFSLYPVDQWSNAYYTPVGTANDNDPAYVFVFNPNAGAIMIDVATLLGATSFGVAPGATYQYQVPRNSGARFGSAGGEPFFALETVGANPSANNVHDWGFTLVPEGNLTSVALVGWGPGSSDLTQNGSPVWVTPVAATRIYVDYNGDRAGPLTDPNGDAYDVHYDMAALASRTLYDPDRDQTAMRVYTLDGTLITAAWGQDPATAAPGNPFLDLGTTVLPFPVPLIRKTSEIVVDEAPAGLSIGDTLTYSVTIDNKSLIALGNVLVLDAPPPSLQYVADSTTRDFVAVPDNAGPNTPFPLDEAGVLVPVLPRGASTTFRYQAVVLSSGSIANGASGGGISVTNTVEVPPPAGADPCALAFTDAGGGGVTAYTAGSDIFVTLTDGDANTDPAATNSVTVSVQNTSNGDVELVTLFETGPDTGVFRNLPGSLPSSDSAGVTTLDGTLFVAAGHTLAVNYVDPVFSDGCSDTALIAAPSEMKVLYWTTDGGDGDTTGALDRVDPVATGDLTTSQTALLAPPVDATVRDTFTSISYSLNAGTANWSGSWTEESDSGTAQSPSAGMWRVRNNTPVTGTFLAFGRAATGAGDAPSGKAVYRQANLSGAATATLRYDYRRSVSSANANHGIDVQVSGNGGGSWTTLASYRWSASDGSWIAQSFDVSAYIAGNFRVRFLGVGTGTPAASNYLLFDNVEVAYGTPGAAVNLTQTPAFCADFVMPAGGVLNVVGYAELPTGTLAANPAIPATLRHGATALANLGAPTATLLSGGVSTITADGAASTGSATEANSGGAITGLTVAHTTGVGSDRLMLAGISFEDDNTANFSVTSVRWVTAGSTQNLAQVIAASAAVEARAQIWSLTAPASGSGQVQVAVSSGTADSDVIVVGVMTFSGVDQTTPLGTPNSAIGAGTTASVTLTSAAGQVVFDTLAIDDGRALTGAGVGAGQSQRWNLAVGGAPGDGIRGAASTKSGAASVTMSWTFNTDDWALCAVPIRPATSPALYQLAWTAVLGVETTIPAGQAVTLLATNATAATFRFLYDSATYPARISLPAETIIAVDALGFFDAPYPGGAPVAATNNGATLYLRVVVSDPFGAYDITGLDLTLDGPGVLDDIAVALTDAHVVANDGCSKTYEYVWNTGVTEGTYAVSVTAHEGTEGITAAAATSIPLSFLDAGTPCEVQFTAGNDGPATNAFAPNASVCVRVTDLDENADPGVAESLWALLTTSGGDSEPILLTETGPNTGVFTGCIPASTTLGTGASDGTLHAPAGTVLTLDYVDPDDPADPCSALATVPLPAGTPGMALAKTLLTPTDGRASIGEPVQFRLRVINTGTTTLDPVAVTDTFPSERLAYNASSPAANTTNVGSLAWANVGPLAPGAQTNLYVTFTALAPAAPATNVAVATSGALARTNDATVAITRPSLGLTKTRLTPASDVVPLGSNVTYRITITNDGTTAIALLPLEDTFSDACYAYVSATPPADGVGAGSLFWADLADPANLAPGETLTVDVTLLVTGGCDPADNLAAVNYAEDEYGDPVPPVQDNASVTSLAARISGAVYNDLDGSGTLTGGDLPLENVVVRLWTDPNDDGDPSDGILVAIATTLADGSYEFLNLPPGNYVVVETDPVGFGSTGDTAGLNDNRIPVAVVALTSYPGNDFFDQVPPAYATLAGQVRYDEDADGDLGDVDPPIAGVSISLVQDLNGNGSADPGEPIVQSTDTDANGNYIFYGVVPGDYVVVQTDLAGWGSSADADGGNPNQIGVTLAPAANSTGNDFLDTRAVIGDRVWNDLDADGIQDGGEPGFSNIVVRLYDAATNLLATTVTDATGAYTFTNLASGAYFVDFEAPAGYAFPTPGQGGDGTLDSDAEPLTGRATVVLAGGEQRADIDAGLYQQPLDLGVTKTVNDSTVATNQIVLWTITLTNLGANAASGIELTDTWPTTELVYLGSWASTGAYVHATGVWSGFGLDVGQTATLTITGQVANVQPGTVVTNFIAITALDQLDTNPANDSDDAAIAATLASIGTFAAHAEGERAVVTWTTVSEIGTAGFHLYRAPAGRDTYERANAALLPGVLVSPAGGDYRYADTGATAGGQYRYLLEEVQTDGLRLRHGPYEVTFKPAPTGARTPDREPDAPPFQATVRGLSATETARLAARDAAPAPQAAVRRAPRAGDSGSAVKAIVRASGLHRVEAAALADGLGWTTNAVTDAIAAGALALSRDGHAVAYLPETGGASLLFWGEAPDSVYTDDAVYRIDPGTGAHMAATDGGAPAAAPGGAFVERLTVEEDRYAMVHAFTDASQDYWYWDFLTANSAQHGVKTFAAPTPGAANAAARVTVHLRGFTRTGVSLEHHAAVSVNGTVLGAVQWTGFGAATVAGDLPAGTLLDGTNAVEVTAVLDAGVPYSSFVLESIDVEYTRRYEAQAGAIVLRGDGQATVTVFGLHSAAVRVVELGAAPRLVTNTTVETAGGGFAVSFRPATPQTRYAVWTDEATTTAALRPWSPEPGLRDPANAADYIVLTVPALRDAAQTLADWRAGQGLAARVVLLDEVYDAFAGGHATPEAIRAFLAHTHAHWARGPRYVVLAGSGTYDYRNRLNMGDNLVPTMLLGTPQGLFASDAWFGDIAGDDGAPEIGIGRLPVLTAAELTAMVQKLRAYEEHGAAAAWAHDVLLAADAPDAGGDFTASSELLALRIPAGERVEKVYRAQRSNASMRTALLAGFNDGTELWLYSGHGGMDRLGNGAGFLSQANVDALANGPRLPVVAALSCIVGRFELPGRISLGESMLLNTNGGAAAVWSPSGLSMNLLARALGEELLTARYTAGDAVIGEAILRAQRRYVARTGDGRLPLLYNLLGDPALRTVGVAAAPTPVDEVIVAANPSEGGTVSGGGAYAAGTWIQISATPNAHWLFKSWSDGSEVNPRWIMVQAGTRTYTAVFAPTATGSALVRTVLNDGTHAPTVTVAVFPAASVAGYAVTETLPTGLTPEGVTGGGTWNETERTVTWGPFAGVAPRTFAYGVQGEPGAYTLAGVAVFDGVTVPTLGTNRVVVAAPPRGTLLVAASPPAGGTVSGAGVFAVGSSQTLQAAAHSGWAFAGWADGPVANPRAVLVQAGEQTYTATFVALGAGSALTRAIANNNTVRPIVTLAAVPAAAVTTYTVREVLPPGLLPQNVTQGGAWNAATRTLTWGPWADAQSRTLRYDLTGPAGTHALAGEGAFGAARVAAGGPAQVTIRVRRAGHTPGDFDGDGVTDIGCYFPPLGLWYLFQSTEGFAQQQFGYAGTVPLPGDFDGDGRADLCVYFAPHGRWDLFRSTAGHVQTQFGHERTLPVTGDFDGDGITDIGCYLPPLGQWYLFGSSTGFRQIQFGYEGTVPVVGDFDGDGRDDIGCYDDARGMWYIFQSRDGFRQTQFGYAGTTPVVGDLDGDGRDDIGCHDARTGDWFLLRSTEGFDTWRRQAGGHPFVGYFDRASPKAQPGLYEPATGTWSIFHPDGSTTTSQFGYPGTLPVLK